MRDTIRFRGATYTKVAEGVKAWVDYETDAHAAFMNDLAKRVRETAGGHADNVEVKRGHSTAWLVYEGQDLGDIDLEWWCFLMPLEGFKVRLSWETRSALRGQTKGDADYGGAELTVDTALRHFKNAFGK